ncbi:MAG: flagellar hook-associated protein FlgK [Sandaracinobacter sp.]
MSDMLSIGQTGVRAYARALDALADNVANATTPGHVRRTVELSPANRGGSRGPLDLDPGGGAGVRLTAILRAVDQLQLDTLRRAEGDVAALDVSVRWLRTTEAALTGPNALDGPLNSLFGSLSDLASDPVNPAVRETFLARADALADQFNRSAADLARLDQDLLAETRSEATALNMLSQALADVNGRLRRATAGSAAFAALADERDRTLARIAGITTIDVALDAKGQATVRIPDVGGALLVQASDAVSARVVPAATGVELRLGPTGADERATLLSGSLAGLSSARVKLGEARARLDELADRIASALNLAHVQGIDDSGADGGLLFETNLPIATPARANGGSARIDVSLADGAIPVPMTLGFDGTQWTLSRDDLGGSISGALPLTLDGLTVAGLGTPHSGDLFRLGAAGGAAAVGLRSLSGSQIATAPRWVSAATPANVGDAQLALEVGPSLAPPATPPFRLSMGAGLLALEDSLGVVLTTGPVGSTLAGDGFTVRVEGSPVDGDSFVIQRNTARSNGNGNALRMLAVRDVGGPAGTIGDQADALVNRVAVALNAQQGRFDIARESRNQAAEALSLSAGVDLDTEATEMLRLQQAYNANARVLQAAREIFETLLQSSRS